MGSSWLRCATPAHRACGSSGEFTAAAFEFHPFAKRVGEYTNGTFHFSNAGLANREEPQNRRALLDSHFEALSLTYISERNRFVPELK